MRTKSHGLKLAAMSFGVAVVISVPVMLLFSAVFGFAIFGAVCLISFLFNFKSFRSRAWVPKSPIILGVIIGLVLQVTGALPHMGDAAVIFFSGVGALFTMSMDSEKYAAPG